MPLIHGFFLIALCCLMSCTSVQETRRSALQLIPQQRLNDLSKSEFERLKQELKLSENEAHHKQIQRVLNRLSAVASENANASMFSWEYILIENDAKINAFALPGGQFGIYTGIFKVALTDDDLAVVLGHEMAHVLARHGGERLSQQMLAYGGSVLLGVNNKRASSERKRQLMTAYSVGSNLAILLPYSRLHEEEADRLGMLYMAKAGYNPRAVIPFWQRMAQEKSIHMPEFISTHPSDNKRMDYLQLLLEEAMLVYENRLSLTQ